MFDDKGLFFIVNTKLVKLIICPSLNSFEEIDP